MSGTLFLIPNTLGPTESLDQVIPGHVQQLTSRLDHFVAENAKTARAFLKQVGTARPIQEIAISELNINTPAQALQAPVPTRWARRFHHPGPAAP